MSEMRWFRELRRLLLLTGERIGTVVLVELEALFFALDIQFSVISCATSALHANLFLCYFATIGVIRDHFDRHLVAQCVSANAHLNEFPLCVARLVSLLRRRHVHFFDVLRVVLDSCMLFNLVLVFPL